MSGIISERLVTPSLLTTCCVCKSRVTNLRSHLVNCLSTPVKQAKIKDLPSLDKPIFKFCPLTPCSPPKLAESLLIPNPALTLDELAALESPPPSPTSLKKSIGQTLSQSKKRAGTLTNSLPSLGDSKKKPTRVKSDHKGETKHEPFGETSQTVLQDEIESKDDKTASRSRSSSRLAAVTRAVSLTSDEGSSGRPRASTSTPPIIVGGGTVWELGYNGHKVLLKCLDTNKFVRMNIEGAGFADMELAGSRQQDIVYLLKVKDNRVLFKSELFDKFLFKKEPLMISGDYLLVQRKKIFYSLHISDKNTNEVQIASDSSRNRFKILHIKEVLESS